VSSLPSTRAAGASPAFGASRLRAAWERLSRLPGGARLFGTLFGAAIPYSATVRPQFRELGPGRAVIAMRDRRRVRNHLSSLHAIALANLGEMSTGLALAYALPEGARTILTRLSMEYLKKARGTIVATCDAPIVDGEERAYSVVSVLTDEAGVVVARATAEWLVGAARTRA
jgi:acyl-coenzyme A thioesterase PaaI-like protein